MRRAGAVFALLLFLLAQARAADVTFVQVSKAVAYGQTSSAAPVVQANGYMFRVRVDLARSNSVVAASVKWPGGAGATRALTNEITYWEYAQSYAQSDSLNFANPNGTYTVYLEGLVDGKKTNVLTLSADGYPAPVHIANFTDAQQVNPQNDFKLLWDPTGTVAGDVMQVRIFSGDQLILDTGGIPGGAGTLSGAATSYTIARNTLASGKAYRVQVFATRRSTSDTTGYKGVAAWALYSRFTEFTLRTVYPTLDVNWYGIAKLRRYSQSSAAAPAPLGAGGYGFTAFAVATDPLDVQSASVKLPNGSVGTLAVSGVSWSMTGSADTQAQLDGQYANGAYELDLQTTHNGAQRLTLAMAGASYPPAPQISNWNDALAIVSPLPFVLKWLPVPGATANDFIQVTIRQNNQILFRSSESPSGAGALNGLASSVVLPTGLLQPGAGADVTLSFLKALSLDYFSYPQAAGVIGVGTETHATLRATVPNITAARMATPRLIGGSFALTISGTPGAQQIVQSSGDLRTWTDVFVTNAPSVSFDLQFPRGNTALTAFRVLTR